MGGTTGSATGGGPEVATPCQTYVLHGVCRNVDNLGPVFGEKN
jgi:hypothetical protein